MQLVSALLAPTALTAARDVQWLYFYDSRAFTPSIDMEVLIHVIGGFATGAVAVGSGAPGSNASGPGAPGYAIKRTKLKAGVTYIITIGAKGANLSTTAGRVNGNDGGASSFVGGGLNIIANGGKGGVATAINVAAPGGLGGTASGGDVNRTGGRGGNIAALAASQSGYRASGAGAVDVFGTGDVNGGDLTNTTATAGSAQTTGGASCTQSGESSSSTVAVNTNPGNLALLDPVLGASVNAINLTNRSIFGKYATVGPSGNVASAGPFGAGVNNCGAFAGSSGVAVTSGTASSNGSVQGSPGGAATPSGTAYSNNARDGLIMLEVLG